MNADGSGQRSLTRSPAPTPILPGRPTGGRSLSKVAPRPARRQLRDLRHERRRERAAAADAQPGVGLGSGLVARAEEVKEEP